MAALLAKLEGTGGHLQQLSQADLVTSGADSYSHLTLLRWPAEFVQSDLLPVSSLCQCQSTNRIVSTVFKEASSLAFIVTSTLMHGAQFRKVYSRGNQLCADVLHDFLSVSAFNVSSGHTDIEVMLRTMCKNPRHRLAYSVHFICTSFALPYPPTHRYSTWSNNTFKCSVSQYWGE